MTDATPVRRIVVALDSSAHGRAAMTAAAEMAERLGAELVALFVEDLELLHVAGLPFARELGADAALRPLERARIERRLREQARLAREACERVVAERSVRTRFEVVRGSVAREILAAAQSQGAELVVVGRASATARSRAPLGRTARAILEGRSCSVAVATAASALSRPVAVLFDRGEASRRALALAVALAERDHKNLLVVIATSEDQAEAAAAEAAELAAAAGIEPALARIEPSRAGDRGATLEAVLDAHGCRTLVVTRASALLAAESVGQLVDRLSCPVLVVE